MVSGLLGHNPLLDYRLPETSVHWWSVDIDPDTFMTVGTGQHLWLGGSAYPRYDLLVISERKYFDVTARFRTSASMSRDFYASGGPEIDANMDWYPTRQPVSIGTTLSADADFRHENGPGYWWYNDPENPTWVPGYNNNSLSASTDALLGPAFGRIRDATPVLEALLIGEALAREGLLTAPLGDAAVQALARTLAGSSTFGYSHDDDRGAKFYYAEIERVLQSSGSSAGRLPARMWLRIREIVGMQPLLDDHLWRTGVKLSVRGGVNASASQSVYNHWGRRDVSKTTRTGFSESATLTFGYPFTARLHLTGYAEARDEPHYSNEDRLRYATATASVSYLLPDRMLVSAGCREEHSRVDRHTAPPHTEESVTASAGVSLRMYVEDRSTLTASVSYYEHRESGSPWPWQSYRGLGFSISLRRYF